MTDVIEGKLEEASRTLIELVRRSERFEGKRSMSAQMTLEITLADGTSETWQISIKRAPQ